MFEKELTLPREPHIEVIARAVLRQGSWILACRNLDGGYFYLPGGHVEVGEPVARAAERELEEETGLKVRARDCMLVTEGIFEARGRRHQEVNLVFHVELLEPMDPEAPPPAVPSLEPGIAFEWLDMAAAADVDLRPEAIRAWLASGGEFDRSAARCAWIGIQG
jgi:8-oxo-dGTP diphosphatase